MTLTLRLYLPPAWPAEDAACDWALLNEQGNMLQRGRSEPRHWPEAEQCEVILSAEQCLTLKAQLPKGARSRPAEVIAYALEDQLINDAEAEHFVIGNETEHNGSTTNPAPTAIWVIARTRLKTLLTALATLQRTPQRIISELQLAPLSAGRWSLCLRSDNTSGYARLGSEEGFAFDLADIHQPPQELQLALHAAKDQPPAGIDIYSARSQDQAFGPIHASTWQTSLGIPVSSAGEYGWRDASQPTTQAARNLLSGEFAPPQAANAGWRSFKPTLWLGATALLVYCLFSFGEWIWLNQQSQALRRQMADSFRAAYPQAQNIIDPPLQMQRMNDQLRRARGQLGSTDFLPLLAAASEAIGTQGRLRTLSYEDGRLELSLQLTDNSAAEQLRKTLSNRGLAVTLRDAKPNQGGIEAVFALRGMP
jgi:general secretion pathway protein L